jgi:hypothetical protein
LSSCTIAVNRLFPQPEEQSNQVSVLIDPDISIHNAAKALQITQPQPRGNTRPARDNCGFADALQSREAAARDNGSSSEGPPTCTRRRSRARKSASTLQSSSRRMGGCRRSGRHTGGGGKGGKRCVGRCNAAGRADERYHMASANRRSSKVLGLLMPKNEKEREGKEKG